MPKSFDPRTGTWYDTPLPAPPPQMPPDAAGAANFFPMWDDRPGRGDPNLMDKVKAALDILIPEKQKAEAGPADPFGPPLAAPMQGAGADYAPIPSAGVYPGMPGAAAMGPLSGMGTLPPSPPALTGPGGQFGGTPPLPSAPPVPGSGGVPVPPLPRMAPRDLTPGDYALALDGRAGAVGQLGVGGGFDPLQSATPPTQPAAPWYQDVLNDPNLMEFGLRLMAAGSPQPGAIRGPGLGEAFGTAGLSQLQSNRARAAAEATRAFEREKFEYEKESDRLDREFDKKTLATTDATKRAEIEADRQLSRATLDLKYQTEERIARIQEVQAGLDAAQYELQKGRVSLDITEWEQDSFNEALEAGLIERDSPEGQKLWREIRSQGNKQREQAGVKPLGPKAEQPAELPRTEAGRIDTGKLEKGRVYPTPKGDLMWDGENFVRPR